MQEDTKKTNPARAIAYRWTEILRSGKLDNRLKDSHQRANNELRLQLSVNRWAIFAAWLEELITYNEAYNVSSHCGIMASALYLSRMDALVIPSGIAISNKDNKILIDTQSYET